MAGIRKAPPGAVAVGFDSGHKFSIDEMVEAIEEEVALRTRVYPGLVLEKKLNAGRAARSIAVLQAAVGLFNFLRTQAGRELLPRLAGRQTVKPVIVYFDDEQARQMFIDAIHQALPSLEINTPQS